ncbi:MAG: hypothetical protein V2J26_05585, partial [Pacificimonas sp.]|nr:hypothetical protein [Pacificimonas sp.]
ALVLTACEPDPRTAAPAEPKEILVEPPAPPPEDPRRYIGRWARTADECMTGWWRFWADELRTGEEGMRCDILPPDAAFSDTELRTVCRTRDGGHRETWTVEYSEDGERMTIRGEEQQEVALVKCS